MGREKSSFRTLTLAQVEKLLPRVGEVYGVDCFVEERGTLVYCGTVIPEKEPKEEFLEKLRRTGAAHFDVTWGEK